MPVTPGDSNCFLHRYALFGIRLDNTIYPSLADNLRRSEGSQASLADMSPAVLRTMVASRAVTLPQEAWLFTEDTPEGAWNRGQVCDPPVAAAGLTNRFLFQGPLRWMQRMISPNDGGDWAYADHLFITLAAAAFGRDIVIVSTRPRPAAKVFTDTLHLTNLC